MALAQQLTSGCLGGTFNPVIIVIEPNGIEARNPRCHSYGIQPGRAGWVGLKQEFYVQPFDVSFGGIRMEEVPSTSGQRAGYFQRSSFAVIGCHSRAMGAGHWSSIGIGNKMGDCDIAATDT